MFATLFIACEISHTVLLEWLIYEIITVAVGQVIVLFLLKRHSLPKEALFMRYCAAR